MGGDSNASRLRSWSFQIQWTRSRVLYNVTFYHQIFYNNPGWNRNWSRRMVYPYLKMRRLCKYLYSAGYYNNNRAEWGRPLIIYHDQHLFALISLSATFRTSRAVSGVTACSSVFYLDICRESNHRSTWKLEEVQSVLKRFVKLQICNSNRR